MRILLVNLTRFGDLLQSQAAITDLARQGHHVGVVCLENFASATSLLSSVAYVKPFSGASLLSFLQPHLSSSPTNTFVPQWPHALAQLTSWRDQLVDEFAFDMVCNVTPTLSARLLSFFVARGRPVTGFGLDAQGFGQTSSSWAAFFQGATLTRGVSPFNIVDLFRRVAWQPALYDVRAVEEALCLPLEPGNARLQDVLPPQRVAVQTQLHQRTSVEAKGYVGLQLGASDDKRRWPVAHFARVGQLLWEQHHMVPVLLGSKGEVPLAQRYAQAATHPFVSMCGETSLADLAALVLEMSLVISNDTGTMHLAAGLGRPVMGIFLATAQPFDTGPYLPGSLSFEPDCACHPCAFGSTCPHDNQCRYLISPELVASYALPLLGMAPLVHQKQSHARVWLAEHDSQGFMALRSLSGHEATDRTVWLYLLRNILRQFLDKNVQQPFTVSYTDVVFSCSQSMRQTLLSELQCLQGLLDVLLQQGNVLQLRPLEMMQKKFLLSWSKVYEQLRSSSYFTAFSVLWVEETQAEGKSLTEILAIIQQYHSLFSSLAAFIGA